MICSALTALSIFAGACSDATPQALSKTPPSFSVELAQSLINTHRANHGLRPLAIDPRLMRAATAHSEDQSRRGRVFHRGSDGSYPKDRARRFGYNPRLASENVAAGYTNTAAVIKDWKKSRGHNANLLRRGCEAHGHGAGLQPASRQADLLDACHRRAEVKRRRRSVRGRLRGWRFLITRRR